MNGAADNEELTRGEALYSALLKADRSETLVPLAGGKILYLDGLYLLGRDSELLRIVGNGEGRGINVLEQLNPGLGGKIPDRYRAVVFVDYRI